MVSIADFKKLALSFHGAIEAPHFERSAFKVKKIFATLDEKNKRACLMLSSVDQSVFSSFDPKIIYPVPNKWGNQGATYFELSAVRKDMLKDALTQAYNRCIEKKPKIKKKMHKVSTENKCNVLKLFNIRPKNKNKLPKMLQTNISTIASKDLSLLEVIFNKNKELSSINSKPITKDTKLLFDSIINPPQ